jgi:aminoglycoside 6'-N-acetyltransferase
MASNVRLRPFGANDLDWFVAMQSDPESVGAHNWSGTVDTEVLRSHIVTRIKEDGYRNRSSGHLVVELDKATPIGDVSWRTEQWGPTLESRCPAIGIALLPVHRGKGYGTAAQRLLIEYLFRNHGVHRVQSDTAADNPAEQVALKRSGLKREGLVRGAEYRDGCYHDHILFGMLRTDWVPDDSLLERIPTD